MTVLDRCPRCGSTDPDVRRTVYGPVRSGYQAPTVACPDPWHDRPVAEPVEDTPPEDHELVMPFVTTTSHGGPHDDRSYVAGAEMAQLSVHLEMAQSIDAVPCPRYVLTDNVPQVDLIAMHYGFTVVYEPWADYPDEWTRVDFTNARGLTVTETADDAGEAR